MTVSVIVGVIMGKLIVLLGHVCSGHGPCPPRPNIEASPNFWVKGLGVHRQGDNWSTHCLHGGVLAKGTANFLANGKPVAKVGDPISCGSVCAQGEPTVIIFSP